MASFFLKIIPNDCLYRICDEYASILVVIGNEEINKVINRIEEIILALMEI